ncbi:metalloregulator ArsR/SmtB family transcription factor [Stappia sp. GBMRC 2046]|uniref:Metalloregulator ArsR/SmtB family transcription factor n=1 Tax=Stappia sediminis TaxID=2692190 RepID=A0A7X3LQY1_9HYPH|nr:metalloregulator ArsR/SmtB family transcription factor [Stappia sediminis]MXN63472.1 metalloregulator ArsR/SmtB family transcription factor [Stappia sediminis]
MPETRNSLPDVFDALGDPVRLAIVERLMKEGEVSAGEIAAPFSISKPAISRHISVLEKAGVIERRVDRQFRFLRVRNDTMNDLASWIEHYRRFWETSFDRLEKLFPPAEAEEPNGKSKNEEDNHGR